mmetsp:Transcript_13974/g.38182  ORF Transcript_13974/g.38182 Transcript_13974/m.38182 type:complete len:241 (-) Transcript_13974:220-942(-)
MSNEAFDKKCWTASSCLADHRAVAVSIPKILDAYVGCNRIDAKLNEAIMLTVNSVNTCPYCTGLHGQLARMAGRKDVAEPLLAAGNEQECLKQANEPAIMYARTFGETDGRGQEEADAFKKISDYYGAGPASSIRALCWFLLWGSLGGNTCNAFWKGRLGCRPKVGSNVLFELLFYIYYQPLYLLIALVNCLLKFFPEVPSWFSAGFGVLLTTIASIWIIPLALVAILFIPCTQPKSDQR